MAVGARESLTAIDKPANERGGNPSLVHLDGVSAKNIRIEKIRFIESVYNIHFSPEEPQKISAPLLPNLDKLLDLHHLFGGRNKEYLELSTFLQDYSHGYVFVTARSGYGKTALLANWVKRIPKENLRICYHFISRSQDFADEENFLLNLCQQLVLVHKLEGDLPVLKSELHALYKKLMDLPPEQGQRLIVIIDALDEADDWKPGSNLFPRSLPEGVFVIFSARKIAGREWLTELDIDQENAKVIELDKFEDIEIADLLKNAGGVAKKYANDKTFVRNLSHVSDGDPFYLRLLIEDILGNQNYSINDLKKQPTGLENYLKKWWMELQDEIVAENAVIDLLGYLLVSIGRLNRTDLINISDYDALKGLVFDKYFALVQRYLIGDEDEGYVLCHPRFQDFISQYIGEKELAPYRERLISYCLDWVNNISLYAFMNLPKHLYKEHSISHLVVFSPN